jgi:hypothetical protein
MPACQRACESVRVCDFGVLFVCLWCACCAGAGTRLSARRQTFLALWFSVRRCVCSSSHVIHTPPTLPFSQSPAAGARCARTFSYLRMRHVLARVLVRA